MDKLTSKHYKMVLEECSGFFPVQGEGGEGVKSGAADQEADSDHEVSRIPLVRCASSVLCALIEYELVHKCKALVISWFVQKKIDLESQLNKHW